MNDQNRNKELQIPQAFKNKLQHIFIWCLISILGFVIKIEVEGTYIWSYSVVFKHDSKQRIFYIILHSVQILKVPYKLFYKINFGIVISSVGKCD